MNLPDPLHSATLIRRYKRFLADVKLPNGRTVVAHCPNPGSMKTCATPGWRVLLSHNDDPRRKLRWTWEIAYDDRDQPILINTSRPNDVVSEALQAKTVSEVSAYAQIQREVRYGKERSRVDFLLTGADLPDLYLEVKNVTLQVSPTLAAFPDAVTRRGQKHLRELMAQTAAGHRAALLFVVSRGGMTAMRPADEIDPVYGRLLREAAAAGVSILARRLDFTPGAVTLGPPLPVQLD